MAVAGLFSILGVGQDAQSLGDAARQARQQKLQKDTQSRDSAAKDGQAKDASGKDAPSDTPPAKPTKVITNDEIPSHAGPTIRVHAYDEQPSRVNYSPAYNGGGKIPAEAWRAQI
jgi:hypothetical protein